MTEGDHSKFIFSDFGKHRFDMLVDGVYAIVLTLLVLELKVPEGLADDALPEALREMLTKFGTYALAFCTVGVIWMCHMIATRSFVRVDMPHVLLNIVALLFVALVPFTAALMGSYPDNSWGVGAYGANIFMIGLIYSIAITRAVPRLVSPQADTRFMKEVVVVTWLCAVGAAFGPALAIISPKAAFYYNGLILVWGAASFPTLVMLHAKRIRAASQP